MADHLRTLLEAALEYAARGLPVFPCNPDKSPRLTGGFRSASTDPSQIRAWWGQSPDAMIGLPTGAASGVFVVDLDAPKSPGRLDGRLEWETFEMLYGAVSTRVHATPSGGRHLLFRWVKEHPVPNRTGLWPGVDIRGDGGYIIVPPSCRADRLEYSVLDDAPVADSPGWLLREIGQKRVRHREGVAVERWLEADRDYALRRLEHEVRKVAEAPKGQRNHQLNKSAFILGQIIPGGALEEAEVRQRLSEAAAENGLEEEEIERTLTSGLSEGTRNPLPSPILQDFGDVVVVPFPGTVLPDSTPREPVPTTPAIAFSATPFEWTDPALFPRREWLFGNHLIRRFVSSTVAPGGVGKTSLLLVEAVAMAIGRNLSGTPTRKGPLRVWVVNLEDPREEVVRRVLAILKHFDVDPAELGGRLFIDSGREVSIVLATADRQGLKIATPTVEALKAEIAAREIDVLIVDPFVKSHGVPENDNMAIDKVVTTFAEIADATGCAVELVHHARKTGGAEATVEDSRGASAMLAGVRSARVLNPMTEAEAARAGGLNPREYFRVTNGKANLAPPPDASRWFRLVSIPLGNGDPGDLFDSGDKVGVVEPWNWPDPAAIMTDEQHRKLQDIVKSGGWRSDGQSPEWIGLAVAEATGLDVATQRRSISIIVKTCIESGLLRVVRRNDAKRRLHDFVELAQPLSCPAPPGEGGALDVE